MTIPRLLTDPREVKQELIGSSLPRCKPSTGIRERPVCCDLEVHYHKQAPRLTKYGKMNGVRCPKCKAKGNEVWVIPGVRCHKCGWPC